MTTKIDSQELTNEKIIEIGQELREWESKLPKLDPKDIVLSKKFESVEIIDFEIRQGDNEIRRQHLTIDELESNYKLQLQGDWFLYSDTESGSIFVGEHKHNNTRYGNIVIYK
ncbi:MULTISPECIES: hypothetical protein [unclassified Paenibacillus]|uniref:hypothetical protein n=1 Tax=unclassified Paenibacillus TaxID=185978 RepID=UPI000CFC3585|nr:MULTISPECIES: hypothetical protein [unclassified Paenibacillus]PRA08867.1 hypothetical protein CQ043_02500 [Paenibacillus sp. MYb63]PRA48801.1 hypothetical protein CQ061_10955 [Paenibacillus sp. MYb67]